MKSISITGIWWPPSQPDFSFRGTLHFRPQMGGTLLSEGGVIFDHFIINKYSILNGRSDNGVHYTLAGLSKEFLGVICSCKIVLEGELYNSYDDIKFRAIRFTINDLNYFFSYHRYHATYPGHHHNRHDRSFHVRLNNQYYIGCGGNCKRRNSGHIIVSNQARCHISDLWSNEFSELFSLLSTIFGYPLWIEDTIGFSYEANDTKKVRIFFPDSKYTLKAAKPPSTSSSIHNIRGIFDNLPKLLYNGLNKKLYPLYQLIYDAYQIPKDLTIILFLRTIAALEAYFSIAQDNSIIDPQAFNSEIEPICEAIRSNVNAKLREKMLKSIKSSNTLSLRNIFKSAIKKHARIFQEILDQNNITVQGIISARNYYTHYNQNIRDSIYPDHKIATATTIINLIIRYFIYIELGCEQSRAEKLIGVEPEYTVLKIHNTIQQ